MRLFPRCHVDADGEPHTAELPRCWCENPLESRVKGVCGKCCGAVVRLVTCDACKGRGLFESALSETTMNCLLCGGFGEVLE